MAKYNLLLPRMGESVSEAIIVKWLKQPGDLIEVDEAVLDIATDKVDSDVPSPIAGTLVEQLFKEDEVAQVGDTIAILETEEGPNESDDAESSQEVADPIIPGLDLLKENESTKDEGESTKNDTNFSNRFYSPLVKNIAQEEGVTQQELEQIKGSGLEGRVTKQDILDYLASREEDKKEVPPATVKSESPTLSSGDEIIEMDRMRKLIADHMVSSIRTSPHVCSFIEADVTNIVNWRNRIKTAFEKQEGTKITYTPIFIEAIAKAIRDYPMINISVSGSQIIKKRNINIGMAAALPSGNLIVPVIKNADQLNLVGITKAVNDLAQRAREGKLKPEETQDGTFTVTNVGSFGSITGTPIINQPQVAILALGAIVKKPAVLETEQGDVIAIRHKMIMSLSYDHRVVDGALGGMFLKKIADYLEEWDIKKEV